MKNIDFIYSNLDKLFTINFTMLAFMITALTILQTLNSERIEAFKNAGYFDGVIKDFHHSLSTHFIAGLSMIIFWFMQSEFLIKIILTLISLSLFFISFYFTWRAYKSLIYFMKK